MRKNGSYHHGDLRRALLDATVRLVERRGPENFTLRAAAKLAGVSDGAPYHHFADKEALLAAVATEGFELLFDAMRAAARKQKGGARDKSQAMGVAYVLFAAEHTSHFRIMFGRQLREAKKYPELADAAARAFDLVRRAMLEGMTRKESQRSRKYLLYGTWAIVHGLSYLAIDGHLDASTQGSQSLGKLAWGSIRALDPLLR